MDNVCQRDSTLLPSSIGFDSRICCSIDECWPEAAAKNWSISFVDSVLPLPDSPETTTHYKYKCQWRHTFSGFQSHSFFLFYVTRRDVTILVAITRHNAVLRRQNEKIRSISYLILFRRHHARISIVRYCKNVWLFLANAFVRVLFFYKRVF